MAMNDLEQSLVTYCQFMDRGRRMGTDRKHPTFEGYLLENARFFGPRLVKPEEIEWGEPKQCFYNSAYHIFDDLLTRRQGQWAYAEGIAASADLGIAIHHGWLVNEAGEVLDLTWRDGRGDTAYFGVAFSHGYVADTIAETHVWGVFCPGEMYNRALISGEDGDVVFHPFHAVGTRPEMPPVDVTIANA